MTKKRFISISILLLCFLVTSISFASSITVNKEIDGKDIKLIVNGSANSIMSLLVKDNSRIYYLDQKTSNSSGEVAFNFKLSKYDNKTYDYKIKSEDSSLDGDIVIGSDDAIIIEEEEASIKVIGYNGTILKKTSDEVKDGDNVLSFTKRVLRDKDIEYDDDGGYLVSIDGLAQFDKGSKSGWMFSVNGDFPEIGADDVDIDKDDYIKWEYTTDLGDDIGNDYKEEEEEVYDKIADEDTSDSEVLDSLDEIEGTFKKLVKNNKSLKEKKEIIKEGEKIVRVIEEMSFSRDNEKIYEESFKNVLNITKTINGLDDEKTLNEDIKENLSKNIGLMVNLLDGIKEEEKNKEYLNQVFKVIKLSNNNKTKEEKISIGIPRNNENEKLVLSNEFTKLAKEKSIDLIKLNGKNVDLEIIPNIIENNPDKKPISVEIATVKFDDIDKKPNNLSSTPKSVSDINFKLGDDKVSKFDSVIKVSLKVDSSIKGDKDLVAYLLKEDGKIEAFGGVYDNKEDKITFLTNHFSKYFVMENEKNFNDSEKHWANNQIKSMASKGFVNGKGEGSFAPEDMITRAEFTALINRMLKFPSKDTDIPFEDVSEDSWYYDSIKNVYNQKLINGKSFNSFDPNGKITRSEMTKIIGQILINKGYKNNNINQYSKFKDVEEIQNWVKPSLNIALKNGLIKGSENQMFYPNKETTRAEATVVLYRLYKLLLN